MIKLNAAERFVLIFLMVMLFVLAGIRYLLEYANTNEITVIRDGVEIKP